MSRELIQSAVNAILEAHPKGIDFLELQKLLAADSIDVQPYAPSGCLRGVSYSYGGFKWPGSKIGREFSAGLIERGVTYAATKQPVRGLPPIDRSEQLGGMASELPSDEDGTRFRSLRLPQPGVRKSFSSDLISPIGVQPTRKALEAVGFIDIAQLSGKVDRLNIGPLSKAMLVLGAAAANLGIEALRALMKFIENLLRFFGIGIRRSKEGETTQTVPALGYEPYMSGFDESKATRTSDQRKIDEVAAKILTTAEAISTGRLDLLPTEGGGARDELVAALQTGVASGGAGSPDVYGGKSVAAAGQDEKPSRVQKMLALLDQVRTTSDTYISALLESRRVATKVPLDTRALEFQNLELARAHNFLVAAEGDLQKWKVAHRFKSIVGIGRAERGALEAAVRRASQKVEQRKVQVTRLTKLAAEEKRKWDAAPAPAVPHSLLGKIRDIRSELLNLAATVKSALGKEIAAISQPELKKAASLATGFVVAQLTALQQEQYAKIFGNSELVKALEQLRSVAVSIAAEKASNGQACSNFERDVEKEQLSDEEQVTSSIRAIG